MTTPSDKPGKPDDEPKSQGDQPGDDASKLLELTSLQSYFNDPDREGARTVSDWFRLKAHAILNEEAGAPGDLFKFAKNWLNEKLLFGPAANIFALALKKYSHESDLFSNRIRQQQALATYKDEETPPQRRYQAALAILKNVKPLTQGAGDEFRPNSRRRSGDLGSARRRLSPPGRSQWRCERTVPRP